MPVLEIAVADALSVSARLQRNDPPVHLSERHSARGVLTYLRQAVTATTRDATADAEHFLERMRRGAATFAQPMLILLSDRDLTAREFEGLVQDSREWAILMARPNVEVNTVCDSDHTFSGCDALERATRITQDWLTKMVRQ